MSDENKAMRERLEASKLGESMIDRGNPDAEVYMFSFDDTLTFAASEVERALSLAEQEKQALRAALQDRLRERCIRDLIAAARDVSKESQVEGTPVDPDLDAAFDLLDAALGNYDSLTATREPDAEGTVVKLREEVATWKACATDADGRNRAQYAACAKERDEQRARAERLESELAEARRQPAQGGLPEVGESGYEVKDMEGKWEEATVESVGDGHVELRGKSGYSRLRRLSDEEKQWRRVPQPKPAVATNEKNRSDR